MYKTIATITTIKIYNIIAFLQSPTAILAPAIVDVTIDGILAIVDSNINLLIFIGSNPDKYVSKSFGVPGIKNRINKTVSIFLDF